MWCLFLYIFGILKFLSRTNTLFLSKHTDKMNHPPVVRLFMLFSLLIHTLALASPPEGFEKVDEVVTISTLASQMKYDVESFSVKPNSKVQIIFKNPDSLPHNLILCTPGKKKGGDRGQEVMDAVYKLGDQGVKMNWEPVGHPRILASSGMVQPGHQKIFYFKAPRAQGDYPYICTFPGHYTLMNGLMGVTKNSNPITNLKYKIYHGKWKKLPEFSSLEPKKEGFLANGLFDISRVELTDHFGVLFTGQIDCDKDGNYTFNISSDDGSQLLIDEQVVVDNDGLHGGGFKSGSVFLKQGNHGIEVRYFESGGQEELQVNWSGPGFRNKPLSRVLPKRGRAVKSIPITPTNGEAIIYRNFIDGAGPRAIGVGYDEGVNLAFDANNMRLAMIWHGDFMDGGRHWIARGLGFQPPAGNDVIHLPEGLALTRLDTDDFPWPAPVYRTEDISFEGYTLGKRQRPTFKYILDEVLITDKFIPVLPSSEGKLGKIRRVLQFSGDDPPLNLYLRLAHGGFTQQNGTYLKDKLMIAVEGGEVLASNLDLRVPIIFKDKKSELEIVYSWVE